MERQGRLSNRDRLIRLDRAYCEAVAERDRYREALTTISEARPIWPEEVAQWGNWCAAVAARALTTPSEDGDGA